MQDFSGLLTGRHFKSHLPAERNQFFDQQDIGIGCFSGCVENTVFKTQRIGIGNTTPLKREIRQTASGSLDDDV